VRQVSWGLFKFKFLFLAHAFFYFPSLSDWCKVRSLPPENSIPILVIKVAF
jgi:hypothetical protein